VRAIKAYGKIGGTAPFILNWAPDVDDFQLYVPTALPPVYPLKQKGGWTPEA